MFHSFTLINTVNAFIEKEWWYLLDFAVVGPLRPEVPCKHVNMQLHKLQVSVG